MIKSPRSTATTAAAVCACTAALLSGCAGANGERPLRDPSPQEQARVVASVQWQQLFDEGQQMASMGDAARGEQYLAAAMQRGGPPERILPALLQVCIVSHRYRAAIEYARPYLDAHPDAWQLQYLVATIHVGLGEALSARQHLQLVLQYHPQHPEAEYLLASILRDDLDDATGADTHFRRYLELEPQGSHAGEARAGLLQQVRP